MKYYVYRHYIEDNTFYVGKGSKNRAYVTVRRSNKWYEFTKNGKFNIEIVKYFDNNKDACDYEVELTQYYKNLGQCEANQVIGNKTMLGKTGKEGPHFGRTHTEEARKKISLANTGRTHTEEARKKMSNNHYNCSGKNNPAAKSISISVNGVIYKANCKKDIKKILLNECNIIDTRFLYDGKVPKKHKDKIDYIKVENKILYKKEIDMKCEKNYYGR